MGRFNIDLKKIFLFAFIAALPIVSINMQRTPDEEPWYLRPFHFIASGSQYAYNEFANTVISTTDLYANLWGVKKTSRQLNDENLKLRAQLLTFDELSHENQRLRDLLAFKEQTKMQLLPAQVIGHDLLDDRETIRINKGTSDGIKKYHAVVTSAGVVGNVFRASTHSSNVLLLTDRISVVDAYVKRSRARGNVDGLGRTLCALSQLSRLDDVQNGDLVLTSGLFGMFPKGLPIGTVVSVKKSKFGMSQDVRVKPIINSDSLEEVFVVLNANNENFAPEDPPVEQKN